MVLSRLLTPLEYGLVGMVATLTAFFQVFADLGLSWATVQRRQITRTQVDNLFWANAATGALLWGLCAAAGPALGRFYGRPELAPLAAAVGAGFALSGLTVQPAALLRRQMRLKTLSLVEAASHVCGPAVGIILALGGYGVWALVAQSLCSQAVLLVLTLAAAGYRPSCPRLDPETARMLAFGGYLAAYGVVNYFARNLDNVIIGKYLGPEQLGFYSRAYFLMLLPSVLATGPLTGAVVPALSVLAREPLRLRQAYLKAVSAIALLSFPAAVGLAVTAPETTRLVYGPKWAPVAPLLVWLSIAGIFQPVHNTMGWLYIVAGKTSQMFLWGLSSAAVLASGFSFGIRWGALGVAVAYAILMTFVLTAPALYFAHRAAGLKLQETANAAAPLLVRALVMGAAALLAGRLAERVAMGWAGVLAAKVGAGAAVYIYLSWRDIRGLAHEALGKPLA